MSEVAALSVREKVGLIENELLKHPQVDIPLRHYFAPGVYAREITIPAGTVLTGRIHKYAQLNILSGGEISVLTDDGMVRIRAPFTVVSPPGTKRIAYAHTECTWTTILATEETDPDKVEHLFTVKTEQEFIEFTKKGRFSCLSLRLRSAGARLQVVFWAILARKAPPRLRRAMRRKLLG